MCTLYPIDFNTRKSVSQTQAGVAWDQALGNGHKVELMGYAGQRRVIQFQSIPVAVQAGAQDDAGISLKVLPAVEAANEAQKRVMTRKVKARFGADLRGRHFALWGLAFKPDTDDLREAPSLLLIDELLQCGATVRAFDPVAMHEASRTMADIAGFAFADDMMSPLHGADALLIVTEWKEFRSPDFDVIKATLKQPVIIDGRNLYDPKLVRSMGIEYQAIGR